MLHLVKTATYQISSELEQEQFQGCEQEKVWCAIENQAQVGNQHQGLPHSHTV